MKIIPPIEPIVTIPMMDINDAASAAIWPRDGYDTATLNHLADLVAAAHDSGGEDVALDALEPIYIAPGPGLQYTCADGRHRSETFRRAGLTRIKAIVLPVGTDSYLFALQQARNAATKLSVGDTRRNVYMLYDNNARGLTQEQIAALVGVTPGRVSQLLSERSLGPKPPGASESESNSKSKGLAVPRRFAADVRAMVDRYADDETWDRALAELDAVAREEGYDDDDMAEDFSVIEDLIAEWRESA